MSKKKRGLDVQKIVLDSKVRFLFPFYLEREIQGAFTFINPEYKSLCDRRKLPIDQRPRDYIVTKEQKDGKWSSRKVCKWVYYWEYDGPDLVVPRGAFFLVKRIFNRHGLKYKLVNKRVSLDPINFKFLGSFQKNKGQDVFINYTAKNGILQAGTGTGKTVMGLSYIARIQQPAIIVVDTNELLEQWKNRITQFLGIPDSNIGHIGGGKETIFPITVALVQTLRNRPDLLQYFGFLCIDECHIAATESYSQVVNNFVGEYVMGLSATPRRRDGKTKVMLWYLGRIALKIDATKVRHLPATVFFIPSRFEGTIDWRKKYSTAMVELTKDEIRGRLIIDNVIKHIDHFGVHLILSRSSKHLEYLISLMPHHFQLISKLLIGKINKKERQIIVKQMMENKLKFIFATDRLLGKGFDEELLSVLHLTTPVKDPGALTQYCGRVTRIPETEWIREQKTKALIFYYFDTNINIMRTAASAAAKTFNALGIEKRVVANK